MREIKFRYCFADQPGFRVLTLDEIERGALAGLSVLSRDAWTGTYDPNGIDVYENDVMQNRYGGRCYVECQHPSGFWLIDGDSGHEDQSRCDAITFHKAGFVVVGDRYEQRAVAPRRPDLRLVTSPSEPSGA